MSTETLVFLALLILVPLIEALLRLVRKPKDRTPTEVPQAPRRPSRSASLPSSAPQPGSSTDTRLPRTEEVALVSHRHVVPASTSPGSVVSEARRSGRRGRAGEDIHDAINLRRAVVLMAILGPCRSVATHDWRERQSLTSPVE